MSGPGWWDSNRLLEAGSSGQDVERLKRVLNDHWGFKIKNAVYGEF
jgi:hypothetical protein